MDKVKQVIKDNIPIIVILLVLILIIVIYQIVENHEDNKIYESGLNDPTSIEYVPRTYEENQYRVIDMAEQDMAILYYKDILDKMINDRVSLWYMLTEEERKNYNNSLEKFDKEIEHRMNINIRNNTVLEYSVDEKSTLRTFIILDSDNYLYYIYERGVWNIEVEFIGYKYK